jgi:hypothetical protein
MFIRYNETNKYYEYDTSGGAGTGPWLILPLDVAQIYNLPVIPPPVVIPPNIAFTDIRNNFLKPQWIYGRANTPEDGSMLVFYDEAEIVDKRIFRIINTGQFLYLQATTDSILGNEGFASISRRGQLYVDAGVKFAAAQVPDANPNVLDDYEEGNWLPYLFAADGGQGTAYSQQGGQYRKVGNVVTAWFDVTLTTADWIPSANPVLLGGFPFPAADVYSVGHFDYYILAATTLVYGLQLHMPGPAAVNYAYIISYTGAHYTGHQGIIATNSMVSGSMFRGQIVYRTPT